MAALALKGKQAKNENESIRCRNGLIPFHPPIFQAHPQEKEKNFIV